MIKFACAMKYIAHLRGLRKPSLLPLLEFGDGLKPTVKLLANMDMDEVEDGLFATKESEKNSLEGPPELVRSDSATQNVVEDLFASVQESEQESQDMLSTSIVSQLLAGDDDGTGDNKRRKIE